MTTTEQKQNKMYGSASIQVKTRAYIETWIDGTQVKLIRADESSEVKLNIRQSFKAKQVVNLNGKRQKQGQH